MKKLIVSLLILVGFISLRIISNPHTSPMPLQAYIRLLKAERRASRPWNSTDLYQHLSADQRLKTAQQAVDQNLREAQVELDTVWLTIHHLRSQRDACEQLLLLGKRGQWEKCTSFLNPGRRWVAEKPEIPISQQERDAATANIQSINQELYRSHELADLAKKKVHQAKDEIAEKKKKAHAIIDASTPSPLPLKRVIKKGKRVRPSPGSRVKGWLTSR